MINLLDDLLAAAGGALSGGRPTSTSTPDADRHVCGTAGVT